MEQKYLSLNLLNFTFSSQTLKCYLSQQETENSVSLTEKDLSFFINYLKLVPGTSALYSTFERPCEGGIPVTLGVSKTNPDSTEPLWSFSFLKKFYIFKLTNYFQTLGVIVRTNFVSDMEVWIPGVSPYSGCRGYKGFTLRVQFGRITNLPELLVSYDGVHSVLNEPLTGENCQELEPIKFSWLLYENTLIRYDEMTDKARRNAESVFPCLNKGLQRALKIPTPAPDKSNRYLRYRNEIESFRKQYLQPEDLKEFMVLNNGWTSRECQTLLTEGKLLNNLVFGNGGTDTEPKNGMKRFGPKKLTPNRKTVFFFICQRNDIQMALTINEYMSGKLPGFTGINKYAGIVYSTVKDFSVYFDNKENPLPEIVQVLDERIFDNDTRYVALYLSPFGKTDSDEAHKAIYYKLKEELLHRSIVSQVIEVEKNWTDRQTDIEKKAILKKGFNFAFPNIAVSLLAKLGGTPWSLANELADELVIGISAFKSEEMEKKYLGSAFSFSGEGNFYGFDCFRSNQLDELAGSILMAVREYCSGHKTLKRLVIHFYKTLSQKELEPIEKGLAKLKLDVPVVVLNINKMFSEDIVGFDMQQSHLMPYSFTYLPVGYNQYLLYNNGLQKGLNFDDKEGYPFPLKISFQYFPVGTFSSEPIDPLLIPDLFEQVCRFSQLYWKSISRQSLPVTLRYPEMLAKIVPHFSRPELPRTGKETLWFL